MPKKKTKPVMADDVEVHCKFDELAAVAELVPNPKNPNRHPEEQIDLLSVIIQKNGWRDRIVISNRSGMIVKGHGRYMAAMRGGLSVVPVEYQDYKDEAEEIKDLIADNKIAELSEVDNEAAFELVDTLGDEDFDLRLAGFQLEDFEKDWTGPRKQKGGGEPEPEIEFTEELLLEHNYVLLYFDNEFDWNVAIEKFGLQKKRDLLEIKGRQVGIGRVLRGAEWLDRLN